jgi:hypothetical protein
LSLVETFKETVELRIESGDIEGICDKTMDKLLTSLLMAIAVTSSSNRQHPGPLQRRLSVGGTISSQNLSSLLRVPPMKAQQKPREPSFSTTTGITTTITTQNESSCKSRRTLCSIIFSE